jgi:hypothetical protein
MKRRDPKLPGVGGITVADVEALDQGRTTLQTIADRVGCSKQAVSRRIKAMRSTGASLPAVAPIPTSTSPAIPADAIVIDAMQLAISANLGVLHCCHSFLAGGGPLGPSAIKALGSAIATARSELALLGVLVAPTDAEVSTEFRVRVMTDAEHEETKRRVELPDDFED